MNLTRCPHCELERPVARYGGFCSDKCQAAGMCRVDLGNRSFCGKPAHHVDRCVSVMALRVTVTSSSFDVVTVRALVDLALVASAKLGDVDDELSGAIVEACKPVDCALKRLGA